MLDFMLAILLPLLLSALLFTFILNFSTIKKWPRNIFYTWKRFREFQEEEYYQTLGFYQQKYNFMKSEEYQQQIKQVKKKQKEMLKQRTANPAVISYETWHKNGDFREGGKIINTFKTLALKAFNGECNVAIEKVKHYNAQTQTRNINKSFERINQLLDQINCEINRKYLELKLEELDLVHEYHIKIQEEKEEEQRRKSQMREEQREQRAIEKEKKEIDKEVKIKEEALAQARSEVEKAMGEQKEDLKIKVQQVQQLEQQLQEALANQKIVTSRFQMAKAGYIYVISNIGSLGENIYRIGSTRRIVDEFISESNRHVPFPFDINAKIFSEDALEMEKRLHQHFENKRVNKVNDRREFFRVSSLEKIEQAVNKIAQETGSVKSNIEFIAPEAEEYNRTHQILSAEKKTNYQRNLFL